MNVVEVQRFHGGPLRVRVPEGVQDVFAINDDVIRFRLPSGLFIDRCRNGPHRYHLDTYSVYAPGEAPGGGAQRIGGGNRLGDVIAIALRHRTYALPLEVPQSQAPPTRRLHVLHPGSSRLQDYWQSSNGKAFLLRNRGEQNWIAFEGGLVVEDLEERQRCRSLRPDVVSVPFQNRRLRALIADLERRANLFLILDPSQVWTAEDGLAAASPDLVPEHARNVPPLKDPP